MQERGREDLPQQGGVRCRDEWMDGAADRSCNPCIRRSCQCECDHGSYYSLHDEMAKSADAMGSNSGCVKASKCGGIKRSAGSCFQIILLFSHYKFHFDVNFSFLYFFLCKRVEPFVSCE